MPTLGDGSKTSVPDNAVPPAPTFNPMPHHSSLKAFLVLLFLLVPALLLNLGDRPVYKIQEVRVAETAREMLDNRDWIVPRYNGELRLQKPPLPYWLTAVSFLVAGVNEFAARLPAVLFSLASVLLLWHWMRREHDIRFAANTVMVLVFSYIGLRYFRSGEADAILLFFITASCKIGFDLLHGQPRDCQKILFGLCLGMGFLSKGPAALAIPLLTLAGYGLIAKRVGQPLPITFIRLFSLSGTMLLAFVAFGWYASILWLHPEAGQAFFSKQVDDTFISGTHMKPAWWYLARWFEFFAPWSVLLLPASWQSYRQRADLPAPVLFAWIWLGVVLVLLTLTINKQMQYALLFAPPAAIILGHYLAHASGKFVSLNRVLFGLFCLTAAIATILALRKSPSIPEALPWLSITIMPLAIKLLLAETRISLPVLLVSSFSIMTYLYTEANLAKEPRKVAAQELMVKAQNLDPLYQLKSSLNDGTLSFYARRVVAPVTLKEAEQMLADRSPIWLASETLLPETSSLSSSIEFEVDNLKLYRLVRNH